MLPHPTPRSRAARLQAAIHAHLATRVRAPLAGAPRAELVAFQEALQAWHERFALLTALRVRPCRQERGRNFEGVSLWRPVAKVAARRAA